MPDAFISLLIVDDHFVVRSGLVASLELEEDVHVVAEASDADEAVQAFQKHAPTMVLMDLQLPGASGIIATARLRECDPSARVLMFSTFARDDEVSAALAAGALGYLPKSASREELLAAIRATAQGESYLPPGLRERLAELQRGPAITPREREILALVARGQANKEIGHQLGISEDTVKRHISNVLVKLEVSDRAEATAEAIRRGIVSLEGGM